MKFLNKMEGKFGRFAVRNLTAYIVIVYAVGYFLGMFVPNILNYLALEPSLILKGQVWRFITWLLVPPVDSSIIFFILMLYIYYSFGTTLERTWGAFRYNLYIAGGVLLTVIGAFVLYAIMGSGTLFSMYFQYFSTYYICLSIFLGFAVTYPEEQVLLYFIIPIKCKWIGIIDVAFMVYSMIQSGWVTRVMIICSLLNVGIFMIITRGFKQISPKERQRKKTFTKAVHKSQTAITKHKCAVCQRTETSGEHLEFRFCSKCNGNYEYCQDHLFTHEHVK